MDVSAEQVRAYRLKAHHLDQKYPMEQLGAVAGACGLQNSPPGAWEAAAYNRLRGCTLQALQQALYTQKSLLQAWSYRGVPVVFPTGESDVFLSPLLARPGEEPWVYTRGITAGLDYVQMTFDELLPLVKEAAKYLNSHTVKSKETLDTVLAQRVQAGLPPQKQALWAAPSMYGAPQRQTVGGAIVSFMLRPCAFSSLVVFGQRQGASPTFTSFENWVGHGPAAHPAPEKQLVRKFLHCYGPAAPTAFAYWLGCSPAQARRLWATAAPEMQPVRLAGKPCFMLAQDLPALLGAPPPDENFLLLAAHDPYLDLKDRDTILPDKARQRLVWKTVANPGAVVQGGRVAGIWKASAAQGKMEAAVTLWQAPTAAQRAALQEAAQQYAAFRQTQLKKCTVQAI